MKKFLTLVVALAMFIPVMARGLNDGSTKADAIDFDWDAPMEQTAGTKWYVVDLAPLYEEDTPALNLFLANKDPFNNVEVSLQTTIAGNTESRNYTITPKQQKSWSADASALKAFKLKEIYLTLTSDGPVSLSARVFEAADLDETCKDALSFNWATGITKPAGVPVWYKVNIVAAKANSSQDVCVVVTNNGTGKLTLKAGQSLDCPSSGVTKRTIELAAGQTLRDTVPHSMINNVAYDELYVSLENDQPISVSAEYANRPAVPVLPANTMGAVYEYQQVPDTVYHENDTLDLEAGTTYYLYYLVSDLNALKKYEPEFTFYNPGSVAANIDRKMAFEVPAYVVQGNVLTLGAGEEQVEVIKKNTLLGLDADTIFVMVKSDKDVKLVSRFKHVREGKACKTNIDFRWDGGHTQEANTTQWYAIALDSAKAQLQDVIIHVKNQGAASANVKASMAFSCPYIDVQEVSRSIEAGATVDRRILYSNYAMMSGTVYVGLETSQNLKFWAELVPTEKKAVVDSICLEAIDFNWEEGAQINAGVTEWYFIDMTYARELAANFPTVFVQNLSNTEDAVITAELSLECPDSLENESRTKTIKAGEAYSKQLSSNMFENIKADTIYLKIHSTQTIKLQIRLNKEAEGASCASAIPFNWTSGNTQDANANLWYAIDLRDVMKNGNDIELHIENRENAACTGVAQLSYSCPSANNSIRNFNLAALGERVATLQNSSLDVLDDSVVYVNLQGTTGLRIWAKKLAPAPFTPITGEGLTLTPLQWDTTYTQTVDTAWYIIPKSEIDKVRNLDEKVKPVAHLNNLGAAENTYTIEAAFAFPIVKKMITKNQKVAAGQHFSDTVPASTFDQFLKKDSIIIRITRPVGSGDFSFRAELVKAFSGNTREDALPIRFGEAYGQSPMTTMWYKLNTADLKKDKTLFNKALNVTAKSVGTAPESTIEVHVYEGLSSKKDMLDEFGLGDYRERKVKGGKGKSHNIPAQAIYAVGDVDLYIQIKTNDSLYFETKFAGEYAPQPVDPKQAEAILVVPNVDYIIPGDNQEHWYQVCVPYIQNNYIYTHAATLTYELDGQATIESTATFQDEMDCAMPVRHRTINKSGKHYVGTKLISDLIAKGVRKAADRDFDVTSFQETFIDSLLHRYATKDSITGYVRIKSDKEIKARLNLQQITGADCEHAMMFDWEHGNVNPADADTWYLVRLDSLIVPDTCDLRLHVDNWSAEEDSTHADIYFECGGKPTAKAKKLVANAQDSLTIDRDFLAEAEWPDLIINFYSEKATHLWAELVPKAPRDTLRDTIVAYVCAGEDYLDTITNIVHPAIEVFTEWYDTLTVKDSANARMVDSITLFQVYPLVLPQAMTVAELNDNGLAPLVVKGMQLFVDSSDVKLTEYYRNLSDTVDTIARIDTVFWAKPKYKTNGDLDPYAHVNLTAADLLKYYPKTQDADSLILVMESDTCGLTARTLFVFPTAAYKYVAKDDTICPPAPAVSPDTIVATATVLDTLNLPRYVDTVYTYHEFVKPVLYAQGAVTLEPVVAAGAAIDTLNTISSLLAQFDTDATDTTMGVIAAKWQVKVGEAWQDMPYTVPGGDPQATLRYIINTDCGVQDTSANFTYTLTPICKNDTANYFLTHYGIDTVEACGSYTWATADFGDGATYTASGTYYYDDGPLTPGSACHQIYQLNLIVYPAIPENVLAAVAGCESYTHQWIPGVDTVITATGNYSHTYVSVHGCDSVVTLPVTINHAVAVNADPVVACDEYKWQDAAQGFDTTIVTSGIYVHTFQTVLGCDSVVTLNVTINASAATTAQDITVCDEFNWKDAAQGFDTTIVTSGTYTHVFQTVLGCDSVVTQKVTVNKSVENDKTATPIKECNFFSWEDEAQDFDTLITTSGTYTHVFTTALGCDSTVKIKVDISVPYQATLDVKAYYGYRIIMINRKQLIELGWQVDSLDTDHPDYVEWHEIDLNGTDRIVHHGYYYNLPNAEPLPAGYQYYALIDIPAAPGKNCGALGKTAILTVPAAAAAPELVPSLARPGENIQIINLDPTEETVIRLYTADGLLQKTYTVSGEESFTIQAANEYGFYMVELVNDSMKSTLRYIVK